MAAFTAASRRARIAAGSGVSPGGVPAQHDRLDPAGLGLEHDRVADTGDAQGVLDVLGIHVEAVRQHDDVLHPARQDQPALASKWPMSPVLYQPSSVKAAAVASGLRQ